MCSVWIYVTCSVWIYVTCSVWIYVTCSVWIYVFNFLGYIPVGGIAGSHGNSIYNILRSHQTVFHSDCTILHSHQKCMSVSISPHFQQHLLLSFWL